MPLQICAVRTGSELEDREGYVGQAPLKVAHP